ncbi:class I SAM-dependent DNA methyltransferase [Chamaesiphon minutus]|uniref:Methylase involved in ubiquinone/menaquinone biosynthesis n=1 Tax=Chamaesiphon minutus (strain ATCC 27169 / PCC 6605) TaxID=1173020 RepID=K9UB24_CHAP6|nr:class I SAM-dependent methyltransferase [Chamaesiphon minutus]AFY91641.1 methylase involved in ubiquinone/menaquinone biosynthesis [Chamaesiphon minutus PCC 6605]
MAIFDNYARYYDLLYQDKDYEGEAQFVDRLIQTHAPQTKTILELGCGTGNHAMLLATAGYQVCGVDLSAEMLEYASRQCDRVSPEVAARLQFSQGDLRQVRFVSGASQNENRQFDAVISLFHVISYQTTNQDLLAAFETAKIHLKPGGVFIFDIWYGPAVCHDPPTVRIKRLANRSIQVTRIAEPIVYPNENLVDVNYHVFIKDLSNGAIEELKETHTMRYLFKPELELISSTLDLEIVECREWLTDRQPGLNTWGVYLVIKN